MRPGTGQGHHRPWHHDDDLGVHRARVFEHCSAKTGIVPSMVVTPNDFTSLDQVDDRLAAFEQRYNATARPFRWKFTPADLEDLLGWLNAVGEA